MKTPIMLLLELLMVRQSQTLPSLSTAVIMLILGCSFFALTDQFLSMGRQCMRLKSVIPT